MASLLIKNATVVTPHEVLNNTSVLVEHGVITHIAPEIENSEAAEVIDGAEGVSR
jgi:alpha-D-ribose 1-methylphosphonate 5-triphosphate diphosphatase